MKNLILIIVAFLFFSCNTRGEEKNYLVDSLESTPVEHYVPTHKYLLDSDESFDYTRYPALGNEEIARKFYLFIMMNMVPNSLDHKDEILRLIDNADIISNGGGYYSLGNRGRVFTSDKIYFNWVDESIGYVDKSYNKVEWTVPVTDGVTDIFNQIRSSLGVIKFHNNSCSVPAIEVEVSPGKMKFHVTVDLYVYDGDVTEDMFSEESGDFVASTWYKTNM